MNAWCFDEDQLGAALDRWAQTRRPNGDTAQALKNIAEFLNSDAAAKLRVQFTASTPREAVRG